MSDERRDWEGRFDFDRETIAGALTMYRGPPATVAMLNKRGSGRGQMQQLIHAWRTKMPMVGDVLRQLTGTDG